ncbi:Phage tail tape measure protein domain-containing protein [Halomonas sp. NYA30]
MADLEQTVAIIFEGVDQMGAGVDSASKRLNSIIGSAQGVVDPIANATVGILKFEAALLAGGVAATGLAVKLAGDFDSQFREISTLVEAPTGSLDEFREAVLAYGSQSTNSIQDVNSAVYSAISAGVDYTDSLEAVNIAEQLSIAGKADLGDTLTVLVSSLNAYGEGMGSASTFSDQLFTTVKNGQTTLPELGGSLANVTGLAATAGVSFGELLAGVATLTATGSGTSEAITQIRGAISTLLKPTSEAATLAEELGIEFNASALESKGFQGVLEDVFDATGGNVEQMAKLFGSVEALNGVLTLTGLGAESFASNIVAMSDSARATEAAFEKMAGTVEQGNQRIANAFTAMMVGVGDPLLDEFGGIQEAIAEIFNAIGASVTGGQLDEFVGLIEGVTGSLEEALSNVATNLPEALEAADLSGFVGGFEAVRDAVAGLFDNADIGTTEGLVSVIQTLGSGVNLLGEFTAGALEQLIPFMETLADLAQWVAKLNPEMVALGGAIGGISIAASGILAGLGGLVTILQALGGSSGVLPVVARAVGGLVTSLGKIAGPAGAAFLAYEALTQLKGTLDEFGEFKFNFSDELKAELDKTTGAQKVANEAGLFSLQKLAEGYVGLSDYFGWGDEASADFTQLSDAAVAAAVEVASAAGSIGGQSAEDVKRISDAAIDAALGVASAGDQLRTGLSAIDSPLVDQIVGLPGTLSEAASALSSGGASIVATSEEIRAALSGVQDAFNNGDINEQQYRSLTGALLELKEGSDAAAQGQQALTGEVLSSEDAILKARQAVLDQTLALQQLASDERIKNMEFAVDFKIAKMETDAQKVEAILNATSATISSTAEAAASMFDTLGSGDLSFGDRWAARDAIEQQLEIQQQAADQQEKLIAAQVEQLRARTQALQSGDGLIKISSDGLEPALEMIMWQVLEKIQMRANAEGAEFLLGL